MHELLVVHPAEHLGIPIQQTRNETHTRSPEHHIMKMPHYKGCIMNMNIGSQSAVDQAGQPADTEKKNK